MFSLWQTDIRDGLGSQQHLPLHVDQELDAIRRAERDLVNVAFQPSASRMVFRVCEGGKSMASEAE